MLKWQFSFGEHPYTRTSPRRSHLNRCHSYFYYPMWLYSVLSNSDPLKHSPCISQIIFFYLLSVCNLDYMIRIMMKQIGSGNKLLRCCIWCESTKDYHFLAENVVRSDFTFLQRFYGKKKRQEG